MSRARLARVVIVFVATLAVPGVVNASIIDYIWEMSGPRMIGFLADCEFDLHQERHECRVVDKHLSGDRQFREQRRLWLTLTGGFYFSTNWDSGANQFDWWTVKMLGYEPTLHVRSFQRRNLKFDHGVLGVSYFYLIGSKFKNYDNFGLKLVPVAVTIGPVNVAYNFRIFPSGFTSEQFGGNAEPVADKRSELVHGFSVGYFFGRR